jgi:hypothetical protein
MTNESPSTKIGGFPFKSLKFMMQFAIITLLFSIVIEFPVSERDLVITEEMRYSLVFKRDRSAA